MVDPAERNRLDEAASPYLRQHADNPVYWQPWDDAALAAARERDVPIFLSIGYAACHWCHVMAEESFADESVATVLNERYVPIKVDREERPDLDAVYQAICQLVTRSGGWPLSVWLTPDGRPFYVGTYFPPDERRGLPGFRDLASRLAETWESDREEVENRADQWMAAIRDSVESVEGTGDPPGEDRLVDAAGAAVRSADRECGGFGTGGPKFPQPGRIHILLRAFDRTGRQDFLAVAREALDAMAAGGMYDHVGGGFHRYATDRQWTVPHFEKMLYDNAELPRAYVEAYRITGDERYADVVRETVAFLERELSHPDGGFYSTLDAQSERDGERAEGAFYVWTPDEVHNVIEDETAADLFCDRYGVTLSGNLEGRSVLRIATTTDDLATEYGMDVNAVEETLAAATQQVMNVREGRSRPARDEKILAGWNGLAIAALAEGALALDDLDAGLATDGFEFVREHLWDGERLSRRYKDGDVAIDGYLEDYAFLARGALTLYEVTGTIDHLAFALDLARAMVEAFWDPDDEALYFTPTGGEALVARPQELSDQSTPSSAGVAIDVLLALSHFAPDEGFEGIAEAALGTYGSHIESNPLQHASLALAADRYAAGDVEFTIVGDDIPAAWSREIGRTFVPNRVLSFRPPDIAGWLPRLGLDAAPPIWADRDVRDGGPTAYVCRSFTCSPPLSDVEDALEWAADLTAKT